MFAAFKLNFPDIPNEELQKWYKIGMESYTDHRQKMKANLEQQGYLYWLNYTLRRKYIEGIEYAGKKD